MHVGGNQARDEKPKMQIIINASSAKQARKLAPWAAKVSKVDGGYMAFSSISDYQTWRKQK